MFRKTILAMTLIGLFASGTPASAHEQNSGLIEYYYSGTVNGQPVLFHCKTASWAEAVEPNSTLNWYTAHPLMSFATVTVRTTHHWRVWNISDRTQTVQVKITAEPSSGDPVTYYTSTILQSGVDTGKEPVSVEGINGVIEYPITHVVGEGYSIVAKTQCIFNYGDPPPNLPISQIVDQHSYNVRFGPAP